MRGAPGWWATRRAARRVRKVQTAVYRVYGASHSRQLPVRATVTNPALAGVKRAILPAATDDWDDKDARTRESRSLRALEKLLS